MSKNTRAFFRIDVMMPCTFRRLSIEEAIENPLPTHPDASFLENYFMSGIRDMNSNVQELITQIGAKSAILAEALNALNGKIDFLMQTVDEKSLAKAIPQMMVNLSAGGLAIKMDGDIKESDKVDLLIQPLEEEDPILVRCNIVKLIPESDGKTTVALEYQSISEDDRRKLVYFIQAKEIEFANQQKTI